MALNPIVFTEKVVRSFLRYQLTAYPFSDEGLHSQMRHLLSMDRGYRDAGKKVSCRRSPYKRLGTLEGYHRRGGINI
jgi:hypothetical protein